MKKRPKKFHKWIDKLGFYDVAHLAGSTPMTVRHWRDGKSDPRGMFAARIVQKTKGEISFFDIYGYHFTTASK